MIVGIRVSIYIFLSIILCKGINAQDIRIFNKSALKINESVVLDNLIDSIKIGRTLAMNKVSEYKNQLKHGGVIRQDYRNENDYFDLFYAENIVLGQGVNTPISIKLTKDLKRQHCRNCSFDINGNDNFIAFAPYSGILIMAGKNGAKFQRDLVRKNRITLIEGSAFVCTVEITKDPKSSITTYPKKTILTNMAAPITNLSVLIGKRPAIPEVKRKKPFSKDGLFIPELTDSIGLGLTVTLTSKSDSLIHIAKGSTMRIDYDYNKDRMFFDPFYNENIVLSPNTSIPLDFQIYVDENQSRIAQSNLEVTGNVVFSFPPSYKGLVITSGDEGATLQRSLKDKKLKVLKGSAFYTKIQ